MNSSNYSALLENVINGNVDGVTKCIKKGVNIYGRTNRMETLLYVAMLHGHGKVANILWNIYASDLKFCECAYKTDIRSTFWIDTPILIGFGNKNCKAFETLYTKYEKCENGAFVNMGKYVMFLLKRDNFKCERVLMLSPTTREGKMLLVSMIKCVNTNGLLDLNAETPDANSLLRASVQSGLFTMFDVLLNYGAEMANIMEIACYAIEFNRIEFLDEIYKRFKFRFNDWLNSRDYFWPIFKGDNWDAFKFVIEKIIAETGFTWSTVLNRTVPSPQDAGSERAPLTVFEYAIYERQFKIAENCLNYIACDGTKGFGTILEFVCLGPESENLLLKMIQCDPIILEYSSNTKVFFHDIVCAMSMGAVEQIYNKYPIVQKIFFRRADAGQDTIDRLLASDQIDKVRCVLHNSIDHLDADLVSSILYKIVGTKCLDLFSYVLSAKNLNVVSLDTAHLITVAVQNVNLEIFNIVMSQTDYDLNGILSTDKNNLLQILLHQTRDDHAELIGKFFDELIKRGVNYYTCSSDGKNLLHHSVEFDNYDATRKLLSLGIDVNESDIFGKLPVHYARSVKVYQLLNTPTSTTHENVCTIYENNTILHLCVSSSEGRLDLIKHILENGGNVNAINNDGKSPIFYVHDFATAELLAKYKPDLNVVDRNGHTPLINFIAEFGHSHAIINLFYDHESVYKNPMVRQYLGSRCDEHHDNSTFFIEMIRHCDICANIMLDLPCMDLLNRTELGNTPLHVAAELKKYDLIDRLIKRGLSLDTRNMEWETPFLFYIRNGLVSDDDDYMRLLKYNPKVNRKSKDGTTPLGFAVRQFNVHTYDLICELLLRGASLLDVLEHDRTMYLLEMAYETQQIFRFTL